MTFLKRSAAMLIVFVMFLWDLVISSVQVAAAVLSPVIVSKPRLVTIPLRTRSACGITMIANFISLTPGTLTIDVSPDRKTLLVHSLLAGDSSESTRAEVRNGIETRVMRVTD